MKEIIVYSFGDSKNLATWSNVPYFFANAMEKRGIHVNRVNTEIKKNIKVRICWHIFRFINKIGKIFGFGIYNFNRSGYYDRYVENKMKEGLKAYPYADIQVVFDYSHITKQTDIPTVMLCDWTIEYYIEEHLKRNATWFERRLIQKQYKKMALADAIITLFPCSFKNINNIFPDKTYYFGHIVNALEPYEDLVADKFITKNILFIGRPAYSKGAQTLIDAVLHHNNMVENDNLWHLDIIGMERKDISNPCPKYCHCWGYLNKSIPEQKEKYYTLLKYASVLVNTTAVWNGASSLMEALYYGTPIIVSKNPEILEMIGENRVFCKYCQEQDMASLLKQLEILLMSPKNEYWEIAHNAHEFAEQFTWDKFADHFCTMAEILLSKST